MSNWFITGGCGFIGSKLVARLLADGHRVRLIDNQSVGSAKDLPVRPALRSVQGGEWDRWEGVELITEDVRNSKVALDIVSGADVIVHLAANTGVLPSIEEPRLDCETNVLGTLNYLEAARVNRIPRFVFASSGAPVGNVPPPIHEELAPHPMSPYGASKLAGEGYCSAYWHAYGVETVALRFGNVYGAGSHHKGSVVAKFIRRALAGEVLEIYGDGLQTRDFIYVDDLIDGMMAAGAGREAGGEVIQLATGREHTVGEVAELLAGIIKKQTGQTIKVEYRDRRLGEMHRNFADIGKAKRLLGFVPKVGLADGLSRTLEYFLKADKAAEPLGAP